MKDSGSFYRGEIKENRTTLCFFSPCLFRFYQRTLCLGDSQQSTLTIKYMCVCGVCVFVCPPFSLAMFVFVYCSVGPWREQKNYNSLVILVLAWISESRHCLVIESSPLSVLSRCPVHLKTYPQCNCKKPHNLFTLIRSLFRH